MSKLYQCHSERLNETLRLVIAGASFVLASYSQGAPKCDQVSAKVASDILIKPERVLLIVEDAIIQHESCACEITKSAIAASKAQPKLIGQIVFTAVASNPAISATVAECAVAVAPDAAAEVKKAVQKALSDQPEGSVTETTAAPGTTAPVSATPTGKSPVSGKNPVGKGPVGKGTAPDLGPAEGESGNDVDFGKSPVAIGGVYLVYPSNGSSEVLRFKNRREYEAYLRRNGIKVPADTRIPPDGTGGSKRPRPVRPPAVTAVSPN